MHEKWFKQKKNLTNADMIVFKDDHLPRNEWKLQSWTKLLRKCHILRAFFLTSLLYCILPSPLPLEAMLLCVLKQPWSLDICRKQHWPGGRGIWYRKSVVVEIVLLRSIVCMEGYKFSSSFVQDCSSCWADPPNWWWLHLKGDPGQWNPTSWQSGKKDTRNSGLERPVHNLVLTLPHAFCLG